MNPVNLMISFVYLLLSENLHPHNIEEEFSALLSTAQVMYLL